MTTQRPFLLPLLLALPLPLFLLPLPLLTRPPLPPLLLPPSSSALVSGPLALLDAKLEESRPIVVVPVIVLRASLNAVHIGK